MADVLTKEERAAIARVTRDLGHAANLSRTSVAWRRRLLAIIDRLTAALATARREERERCARLCEAQRQKILGASDDPSWTEHFSELSDKIMEGAQ